VTAETLHLVIIAIAVLAVVYKAIDVVRRPRPALWVLWSAMVALVVALVLGLRSVALWIDGPVSGTAWLAQHVVVFVGMFALQAFFIRSTHHPAQVVRAVLVRACVILIGIAAMTVLWGIARVVEVPDWGHVDWSTQPWSAATNLVFVAWVGISVALNAQLADYWSRVSDRVWLRRGLRVLAVGSWVSVCWAAHRVVSIAAAMAGFPLPWDQQLAELALLAVGLCTALVGLTLPSFGPRCVAARVWVAHYRSFRRLEPLWTALCAATPSIALTSPAPWWHVEYRLYRRVIEIWDGRAALRAYVDPTVVASAVERGRSAGLAADALAASAEAEGLLDALRAKRTGRPLPVAAAGRERRGSRVLADEVVWLEQVASAARWTSVTEGSSLTP